MARRRKKSFARMATWLVVLALLTSAGVAYWLWRGIAVPYQGFAKEGVFVSTALPNPIYCIKWDRQTKFRVQARFLQILDEQNP